MTKIQQLENEINRGKIIRTTDFRSEGIPTVYFSRLEREGVLLRLSHGVYIKADMALPQNASFAFLGAIAPEGVICLQSALKFHDLTDENPHRVHVALPAHRHFPKCAFATTVYSLNDKAYSLGVEERHTEIGMFKVYSVEKTLVDCFKFRNRVGLDVAQRALREAYEKKIVAHNAIWEIAVACRMTRVMRPYLEMCV